MPGDTLKRIENLHIIFWLLKDTCWMLDLKWLGTAMMIPTLSLAIYFVRKTWRTVDVYLNAAIFCWILANSFWMMMEFFNNSLYKELAAIPFSTGILMVIILYRKHYQLRKAKQL
jgi:hypothetical protein